MNEDIDIAVGRGDIAWLSSQFKECREELKIALDTANRSSKAVLKWNAEIEQRTKDACKEACKQKIEQQDTPDGLYLYEIEQAIDSVGGKP